MEDLQFCLIKACSVKQPKFSQFLARDATMSVCLSLAHYS